MRRTEKLPNGINLLHLSDLHMGLKPQGWLLPSMKRTLFSDLSRMAERTGGWDVVVFSGDLTQSGSGSEFVALDELLTELWDHFATDGFHPKLFPIPGNHDLSRPDDLDPTARTLNSWHSDAAVQNAFWENNPPHYRECVRAAFANYSDWLDRLEKRGLLPATTVRGAMPGDLSAVVEIDNSRLGLVGLNSSWLQLRAGEYRGRLSVAPQQLMALTSGNPDKWCEGNAANVIVTHHPHDWLSSGDLQTWRGDILANGRFDAHLFGHMHEATSYTSSEGGFPPRRAIQAASLFGLEHYGNSIQRIHGYSVISFAENEGVRTTRHWPRKAVTARNGTLKLAPNIEFDLTDDSYVDDTYVIGKAPTSIPAANSQQSAEMSASAEDHSALLHSIRRTFPASDSALVVRQVEQAVSLAGLRDSRALWIAADWGQGSDEFVRCLQDQLDRTALLYRIDCSGYRTRDDFVLGVKTQFGCSFEELFDLISLQQNCFIVLDDVSTEISNGNALVEQHYIDSLIGVILEYCDNARVVVRSQRPPGSSAITAVTLKSLDEADTHSYISAHAQGGKDLATSVAGPQLFKHTDGVPARIETALRDMQIVGANQLHTLNPDVAGKTATQPSAAPGLAATIEALSSSKTAAGPLGLLKALTMFPKGEQLATLRRFSGSSAFYPADAIRLVDLGLVDAIDHPTIGDTNTDNGRALVVKRPVRDFLYALLPERELRKLNSRALEIYFGNDWGAGVVKTLGPFKFDDNLCSGWQISNASTLALRAVNESVASMQATKVRRAYALALSYGQLLLNGHHYRAVMELWSDALPLFELNSNCDISLSDARIQHAKALRMSGFRDRAISILTELATTVQSKADKQSVFVNLALAYESANNIELARESARSCVKIGSTTHAALQAQSVLLRADSNNPNNASELLRLEETARKRGALVVASSLAIARAEGAESEEAKSILKSVCGGSKGKIDKYHAMKARVKLAKISLDEGSPISVGDLGRLIDAYHYLYGENFSSWFNDCHDVLWRVFESRGELDNLMRIFRHSSLKWRVRDQVGTEKRYIKRLGSALGERVDASILLAGREMGYFMTRLRNMTELRLSS